MEVMPTCVKEIHFDNYEIQYAIHAFKNDFKENVE